jgi:hypothetical protein
LMILRTVLRRLSGMLNTKTSPIRACPRRQ